MRVGTCTLDDRTSWVMNSSRVGRPASSAGTARGGGVLGGVGGSLVLLPVVVVMAVAVIAGGGGIMVGSHWMTLYAAVAR